MERPLSQSQHQAITTGTFLIYILQRLDWQTQTVSQVIMTTIVHLDFLFCLLMPVADTEFVAFDMENSAI